ncbi:uncharacterized protein LOC134251226 isoform X2 [Saccostrea cucullata]
MSEVRKRDYPCVCCKKRTNQRDRRRVTAAQRQVLQKWTVRDVDKDEVLCSLCRMKIYSHLKRKTEKRQNLENDLKDTSFSPPQQKQVSVRNAAIHSPPSVTLSVPSTSSSHSSCFICRKPGPKLVVVSSNERHSVFLRQGVLIPSGSRCCTRHIPDGRFTEEALEKISAFSATSTLNRTSIVDMLMYLREIALLNGGKRIDFDDPSALSEKEYVSLTGISKVSFDDLLSAVDGKVKNTSTRSVRTSLGIFLLKMKSGLSNEMLSTILNVSKSSIHRAIAVVRRTLMETFVPKNVGFQHISREDVIQKHTRPLAESLFGGTGTQALLVLDGTYIYIQKSMNFAFQRKTYSLHKGRPLVKPMIVVTTSGYFLSVLGPYIAKNNDAAILNHIMKTNKEDVLQWVEENDVFIVDRGFRDSLTLLEDLGLLSAMPAFMKKGEKQMSTEDANTSRLVTKIRWVVESANARIKRWKFFDRILPSSQVPFISDYIKIVCGISNKYFPPLSTGMFICLVNDKHLFCFILYIILCIIYRVLSFLLIQFHELSLGCTEEDAIVAAKMQYLSRQINHLKEEVEEKKLDSRSATWKHPDELQDFPRLDEDQLRELTCGTYQVKLSSSYAEEHFGNGSDIMVHKEDQSLIRVRIRSRHVSSKSYLLWIRYDEASVIGWYCKCRAGARVVGMCAHIAAVIWYLGFGRHMESFRSVRDWSKFIDDAAVIPDAIDESESEDDSSDCLEE